MDKTKPKASGASAKAKSASQEALDQTKPKTTGVPAKAKSASQQRLDQSKRTAKSPAPAAAPSVTVAEMISDTSGSMSVAEMTGRSGKKPPVTQTKRAAQ